MRIIITSESFVWDYNNPVLEKYAENVVVVCYGDSPVTNKYRCIVCGKAFSGRGTFEESNYKMLLSKKEELIKLCEGHRDILFLTDSAEGTFYPYLVLKDVQGLGNMHLWCRTPWNFEGRKRKSIFNEQIKKIGNIKSLLYVDSEELHRKISKGKGLQDVINSFKEFYINIFPSVANSFAYMSSKYYFFDFSLMQYVEANDINIPEVYEVSSKKNDDILLGVLEPNRVGEILSVSNKETVEYQYPKSNGKEICKRLRAMRSALAKANNIEYSSNECTSSAPCSGTCPQCDREMKELQEKLCKIPECRRVYPQFIIERREGDK